MPLPRHVPRSASLRSASLALVLLACLGCPGCHGKGTATPGSAAGTGAPLPQGSGTVVFRPAGRTLRIKVDVARTPEQRSLGLMYRKSLPELTGMLFIFPSQDVQSFWMHNTYIPLDMIFVDEQKRIVGIVENAEPLTKTSRSVERRSRYVIEVNGGFCKRHGLTVGASVELLEDPPRRTE